MTTTRDGVEAAAAALSSVMLDFACVDVDRDLLEATAAGPVLVTLLAAVDPALLSADAQLAFVAASERCAGWLHSLQQRGLLAFAGATPRHTPYQGTRGLETIEDVRRTELAAELHWSEPVAHIKLTSARVLAVDLPNVAEAVARGVVPELRTRAITDGAAKLVAHLDTAIDCTRDSVQRQGLRALRADLLAQFEAKVLAYAVTHDLMSTRRRVRDVIAGLDPAGAAARCAKARHDLTNVSIAHDEDGMSTITATMPSEQAIACLQLIDGLARHRAWADPGLAIGVRRADALHALLMAGRGGAHGTPDTSLTLPVLPVRVHVTIDLPTLLGLNDASAVLDGVGPIPASLVRELVAADVNASFRRLIVEPVSGAVTDVAANTYRIDARTRRLIEVRDQHCRFPGCTRPAHVSECDHATPFGDGGTTTPANLGLACKRHHQCKTHADWSIDASGVDGACTWTSPHGRQYRHDPLPALPLHTLRDLTDADLGSAMVAVRQRLLCVLADADFDTDYRQPTSPESVESIDAMTLVRNDIGDTIYARNVLAGLAHGPAEAMLTRLLRRQATQRSPQR